MSLDLGKKFLSQKNFKDAEKIFLDLNKNNNTLIADNGENPNEESVLVSEIIIEGWENHP